jgi:hypothetical protein
MEETEQAYRYAINENIGLRERIYRPKGKAPYTFVLVPHGVNNVQLLRIDEPVIGGSSMR